MNDITIDKDGNIILNDYRDKPDYLKRGNKLCVYGRYGNMEVHDFHNPIWKNIDTSFEIGYIDGENSNMDDIYDELIHVYRMNGLVKKYDTFDSYSSVNDMMKVVREMKHETSRNMSTASIIEYWANPVIYKNKYVEIRKKDLMIFSSYLHAKLKNDSKYN